jgi:hypothetical protein
MCAASDQTAVAKTLAQAFSSAASQNINSLSLATAEAAAREYLLRIPE